MNYIKKNTKLSDALYILLVAFLFCGCGDFEDKQQIKQAVVDLDVVEFDGCEYLVNFRRLVHKGNCKFCIERSKK
jgi:hypothetical protein